MKSDPTNLRYLRSLETKEEKLRFMTGGYVTVGKIGQVKENSLVYCYCPRIRGIFIGDGNGVYMFDNPEEAKSVGERVMEEWKVELSLLEAEDHG